ncbi:hypothetical protein J2X36_002878 [Methylobacterium sp. BE186]|uniref:hypothetical protein n=1 Tax=Methylobacterium sp. BE186 TaxID=2817715 RepID=UPI0028622F8E|nr:hypothetical protein [Methylobacterium sp. BE186]MDR7038122.1 hypothetical protein [Methylobacterium sp. BE186]
MIALYAFVLQIMIAGIIPIAASGPDGILCLHESDIASAQGKPAPVHHHADCCTAAPLLGTAEPPRATLSTAAWMPGAASRISWVPATETLPRAPPGQIPHPRGPPAA